jgi:hypothetical protein
MQLLSGFLGLYFYKMTFFSQLCTRNRGRRTSSASTGAYSLSQNYQLGENLLSMRLILPLDVSYALLYSLYSLLVLLIRFQRSQLSKSRYIFYYDCAMLVSHRAHNRCRFNF